MGGFLHTPGRKRTLALSALLAALGLLPVVALATGNWRWINRHTFRLDLASGRERHTHTVLGVITLVDAISETWISRSVPESAEQPRWVVTADVAPPVQRQSFNSASARAPSLIHAVDAALLLTPLTDDARAHIAGEVVRRWQAGDPPDEYLTALLDSLMRSPPEPGRTIGVDQLDPLTHLPRPVSGE